MKEKTAEEQKISREQRRFSKVRLRASQSKEQSEAAHETIWLEMRNHPANNRDQQVNNFRRARRDLPSGDLDQTAFRYHFSTDYFLHPIV